MSNRGTGTSRPLQAIIELERTEVGVTVKYIVKSVVSRTALTLGLRVALVLFGAGMGAWAVADESDPTPPAETAKSNDDGKLICKQEPVTGSNIKKKTCRTQKQLDEQREASKGMMNGINQGQGRNNGSGG